jgi:hypothetical protein
MKTKNMWLCGLDPFTTPLTLRDYGGGGGLGGQSKMEGGLEKGFAILRRRKNNTKRPTVFVGKKSTGKSRLK